ncbi:MAG: hypothetical protein LBQ58_07945 [Synergistaceae bacterium]|nr:hypothetical protein [Synergistaceae bacterium]
MYKYSKIYSGGEPELIECDVFRTVVPLALSDKGTGDNGQMSDKMSNNGGMSDKNYRETILAYIRENGEVSAIKAAELIGRNSKTARRELLQLINEGVIVAVGANRNRKYKAKGINE